MEYFLWGIIILFIATAIFYIATFSLFLYWHEERLTLVVPPVLFTFEFFLAGFLVVTILTLAMQYIITPLFAIFA